MWPPAGTRLPRRTPIHAHMTRATSRTCPAATSAEGIAAIAAAVVVVVAVAVAVVRRRRRRRLVGVGGAPHGDRAVEGVEHRLPRLSGVGVARVLGHVRRRRAEHTAQRGVARGVAAARSRPRARRRARRRAGVRECRRSPTPRAA